jgi:hypothetical protein
MTRVIAAMFVVASFSLLLSGCDTQAEKGATPPRGNIPTPAKGPIGGAAANPAGGPGASTAPMVLPPPPGAEK